jgi:hypothetical protein
VAKKKFDPLWEIIDEKRALQNVEPRVDLACPHCQVKLELGPAVRTGEKVTCGLCGGTSVVEQTADGPSLKAA